MEQQGGRVRELWRWRRLARGGAVAGGDGRAADCRCASAGRAVTVRGLREFHRLQAGSSSGGVGQRDARSSNRMGCRNDDGAAEVKACAKEKTNGARFYEPRLFLELCVVAKSSLAGRMRSPGRRGSMLR